MNHEERYTKALVAIADVYSDSSVTVDEVILSLKDLRDDIDTRLDALDA